MDTPPALPSAPENTTLYAPLGFPCLLAPSNSIKSLALMVTVPASPTPKILASRKAPLSTARDPVVMNTPPASPSAPGYTTLTAPLSNPALLSSSNLIESLALMVTVPAFPTPRIIAPSKAPLSTSREPVVMDTPPALPFAPGYTKLSASLEFPFLSSPSNLTKSVAVISILPALPTPYSSTLLEMKLP